MRNKASIIALAFICFGICLSANADVERWGIFELSLNGPAQGNPFVGVEFSAVFKNGDNVYEPEGFYDGNGVFKIRFMPDLEGTWTYETKSNYDFLNGKTGRFICTAPSASNHGPVRVRNQYHFEYADGTAYYPFGTTIYEWAFLPEKVRNLTLESLKSSPFNKARMLLVFPYRDNYMQGPDKLSCFPYEGDSKDNWDFSRFDPEFFRGVEKCVSQLNDLGIEADLIIFRPYDGGKIGFDTMDMDSNERFLRYTVARFAAYKNIWWSLCNENSFIRHLTDEDWDVLFRVLCDCDPYSHLRSIHNADRLYNYTHPWVTHASLQYHMTLCNPGISAVLRDIYRKPIVHDEIQYEGDIEYRWGQLSGEDMVYRFWNAYVGGAYATHGESLEAGKYGVGDGWISIGGKLVGQSPSRIAFLRNIVESGPKEGIEPIDHCYIPNMGGKSGSYYLIYFGKDKITQWPFELPKENLSDGMKFKAEIIDTWNMTVEPVDRTFEIEKINRYKFADKNRSVITLPSKPYMALRITGMD